MAVFVLAAMGRAFRVWQPPVALDTIFRLSQFCFERAAFMVQTNLYGYLPTRAGLQHFNLFTDKTFAAMLRPARSRLIPACLDDVSRFAAALLAEAGAPSDAAAEAAAQIHAAGLETLDDGALAAQELAEAQSAFIARLPLVDWTARRAPHAFDVSSRALIVLAPIVDDLKDYDTEIVINSMRFKWMDVRADLRRRLDPTSVLASLR